MKIMSGLIFLFMLLLNLQVNAAALVSVDSSEIAKKLSFKKLENGAKFEVSLPIAAGFSSYVDCLKPDVKFNKKSFYKSSNIIKIDFKEVGNKLVFTVSKDQLPKTSIQLIKLVRPAKPGETGGVFHQYTIFLKDYFKK